MWCSVSDEQRWDSLTRLQGEMRDGGGEALWFALDGREYVVRDEALLARADRIAEPVEALGREQGRLGAMQGKLGAHQGRIGHLQGPMASIEAQIPAPQADPGT